MANVYGNTVQFTKENNTFRLWAKVTFGASGAAVLDTNNSRGICNFSAYTTSFTGNTTASSVTVSSVSSFSGLFPGMTVTGSGSTIQASTTISTLNAGGQSLALSQVAAGTQPANPLVASGGQYLVQFGTEALYRVTPFVKLLGFGWSVDESIGSAAGSQSVLQLAPNIEKVFMTENNISSVVVPKSPTTMITDASIVLQMGTGNGTSFTAVNPTAATTMRFWFDLGNATYGIGQP